MNYIVPKTADELLAGETEQLERIKTDAGVAENIWHRFYMPMLRAYVEQVQTLPFSKECFSEERGAVKFGLLAAMLALRVARAQVFLPGEKSEALRSLAPQFWFGAMVATLATGVVLVTQNVCVETAEGSSDYHPLVCPVSFKNWLSCNPTARMTWRVNASPYTPAEASAIAARFIPSGMLNDFDLRVPLAIYGAIAPTTAPNGVETTLAWLVRQCTAKVINFQMEEERKLYRPQTPGHPNLNATAQSLAASAIPTAPVTVPATPASIAPTQSSPGTASAPIQATSPAAGQTAPAAPVPATVTVGEPTQEDALAALHKASDALKQWFQAINRHEKFDSFIGKVVLEPRGVIVPINMLSMFGLSGNTVRGMLIDAGVVVEMTEDRRGFVLLPALKPFFTKPKA